MSNDQLLPKVSNEKLIGQCDYYLNGGFMVAKIVE